MEFPRTAKANVKMENKMQKKRMSLQRDKTPMKIAHCLIAERFRKKSKRLTKYAIPNIALSTDSNVNSIVKSIPLSFTSIDLLSISKPTIIFPTKTPIIAMSNKLRKISKKFQELLKNSQR